MPARRGDPRAIARAAAHRERHRSGRPRLRSRAGHTLAEVRAIATPVTIARNETGTLVQRLGGRACAVMATASGGSSLPEPNVLRSAPADLAMGTRKRRQRHAAMW